MGCQESVVVNEGSACVLLARIIKEDGLPIKQEDITSISFSSTKVGTTGAVTGPTAVSKTDVIFDTLQLDRRWTSDRQGYNFKYSPDVAAYPDGDADYYLLVTVTPSAGRPLVVDFAIRTKETYLD